MSNFEKKKLCLSLMFKKILQEPEADDGMLFVLVSIAPLFSAGLLTILLSALFAANTTKSTIVLFISAYIASLAIFFPTGLNSEIKYYTERCLIDSSSILTFERFQSFYTINPKRFNFELLDNFCNKALRILPEQHNRHGKPLRKSFEQEYITIPFKTKEDAFLILLWYEDRKKNAEKREHDKKSMENNELLIRFVKKDCENFLTETEKERKECLHDLENQIENLSPKS